MLYESKTADKDCILGHIAYYGQCSAFMRVLAGNWRKLLVRIENYKLFLL